MNMILGESGIQNLHDQVVSLIAQRWARAFQCRVTIKTEADQNPWAQPDQQSDIIGWTFGPHGNRRQWSADVETEESLSNPHVLDRWRRGVDQGLPFFLFVPRGTRELAAKQARAADILFNGVYEYCFVNNVFQVV